MTIESSPFSNAPSRPRLRVETGSPLAEVFLIDHSFALVERSLGQLNTTVEAGVYKVKARLAEASTEQLVVLNKDTTIDLGDQLPVASPAPLEGTSQTHEFHMYPAREASSHVAMRIGKGAQIFLCARRWRDPSRHPHPDSLPAMVPPLLLHALDGRELFKLEPPLPGELDPDEPIFASTVEVDPGGYTIRCLDPSGLEVEQSVHAVAGWQIQVFLIQEESAPPGSRDTLRAALPEQRISILMGRNGFDPADPLLKLVEEARVALAEERNVATDSVTETLFAKFDNPMLGLFGAHLMLLARDAERTATAGANPGDGSKGARAPVTFEQELFDHVVGNLRALLGDDHPDATALATQTRGNLRDLRPIRMAPMLWKSWTLLIEASNERPDLVDVETWRRTLGVLPTRPFFTWSTEHAAEEAVTAWGHEVRNSMRSRTSRAPLPTRDVEFVADAADQAAPDMVRQRLSRELLAPRAVIDQVAERSPL